ncbi:Enzyme that catalyzes the fourth step in the histidine pathway [Polyrhizophydium stewartii]|uniref:1-(5-phosphoribosyl)-5-[(5-phosphoribosylamino)methylideneamino] imidazole-4-carboxamide isomerase n=1 Tax=Polyrhizophydium stewartii TaxID=2732419 RepID=A0ABR4N2B8_9FUNG
MTIFRPCIDLHEGAVKQIVGASLSDAAPSTLRTNFVSSHPPAYYAGLYRGNGLRGAHVIKLGPGNDAAAREALAAWPRGLQVGGGITIDNAGEWLEAGADKVIVTSWLFPDARLDMDRLRRLTESIGRQSLVVDLSCKRQGDAWIVAMNKWQTPTDLVLSEESMADLGEYAAEFLVHAADVEGLCQGVDEQLVQALGRWSTIPCTYAGGAKDLGDIALVDRLSNGRVDLTYGSALDIFGGSGVKFDDLVKWNQSRQ